MQKRKNHTKAWSQTIDKLDGFLVVTAEYNFSVPAALKNAFDYSFREWNYKPVAFVSYGADSGGARAVEHLRGISADLKMYDLHEQLLIHNYWNNLGGDGAYNFTDAQAETARSVLVQLIFWAEAMKPGREKLANA